MSRRYPVARIDAAQETLAGVSFADPYRWLEPDNEETRQWQRTQAQLATAHVRKWPHFERLRSLVAQFTFERLALPRYAAGQWFRTEIANGASHAHVVVSDEPLGEGRVLFDPDTESGGRPPFLSWLAPAPDGRTLALGVCTDGSENNTIRLIDVATGELLPSPPSQTLMDNWTGGVQWLPDSSAFFFSAICGHASDFVQNVYLHRRGAPGTTEEVKVDWSDNHDYRIVTVSRDGRYAIALERLLNPIPVALARLTQSPLRWRPFVSSIDGTLAGHVVGERYIAVTDVGAPRGRLVAIPLDVEDPNNAQTWEELVPESDATLRSVTVVGESLYLAEFVDTYSRLRSVTPQGSALEEVQLPDRGAISELPFAMMNLVVPSHSGKFLFGFSSLTASAGIYCHTPGHKQLQTLRKPQVRLQNAVVEDCWAVSTDGTRIPYHLVYRSDVSTTADRPTLIYAYGGFNYPLVPQFPGPMAAFIAAGGIFVHAHLRGGGEFGLQWWQAGRMARKQNGYEDLYAIAEALITARLCTSRTLAVTGASNGGLMAAVALTQRPHLWAVAVPRVPVLDLIGACREPYGKQAVLEEMANVEDPQEVQRLATFSPYHLICDGVSYPAVFLDAGDTDPRCPPWHARKFVARLQAATAGAAPILLHIWEHVGHGWATDKAVAIDEHTEWLAFVMQQLAWPHWFVPSSPTTPARPTDADG